MKTLDTPMMECGHAANSIATMDDGSKIPACVICAGIGVIGQRAYTIAESPNLNGRLMICECKKTIPSDQNAAFFNYRPEGEFDWFYCGCRGWD